METGTLVPSVTAALAVASVLGCRVEDLFSDDPAPGGDEAWFGDPLENGRYWQSKINNQLVRYPIEWPCIEYTPHDGVIKGGTHWDAERADPGMTLVVASCDPAIGLLAHYYRTTTPFRMIVLVRSSRTSLELVSKGLVHMGGVHLARDGEKGGNAEAVHAILDADIRLLRIARWEEGLAYAPSSRFRSPEVVQNRRVRLVGRERGSGAGQCLAGLLGNRPWPSHLARDHRGVAEAIRSGWADAGICVRLAGVEAGLGFLAVCKEPYDLCYLAELEHDPRIQALIKTVRSPAFRSQLSELPGYHTQDTGLVSH